MDGKEMRKLIWMLPEVKLRGGEKLGPAFGVGAGCGVGVAVGLVGGFVIGPGLPIGLQLGLGFGAGCGIGVGFGYGWGKGNAYDKSRNYSNLNKIIVGNSPKQVREFSLKTEKLLKAISREIDKWRRE